MTGKITADQLREHVKALGEKFLQRTATQIAQLREAIERLATVGEPAALRTVQDLAHKIHGSGAMFGFDRISDLAGELQELSVRLDRVPGNPDRQALAALAADMRPVLEALAAAFNAAEQGS